MDSEVPTGTGLGPSISGVYDLECQLRMWCVCAVELWPKVANVGEIRIWAACPNPRLLHDIAQLAKRPKRQWPKNKKMRKLNRQQRNLQSDPMWGLGVVAKFEGANAGHRRIVAHYRDIQTIICNNTSRREWKMVESRRPPLLFRIFIKNVSTLHHY